jgi:hypothetical protein
MPLLLLVLMPCLALAAAGCARPEAKPAGPERPGKDVVIAAVVRWIPVEGGFFGLVARDGAKYLPLNLPEGFRRDGLSVRVRGRLREEAVTAYMWGRPLMIHVIEVLE